MQVCDTIVSPRCASSRIEGSRDRRRRGGEKKKNHKKEKSCTDMKQFWESGPAITCWADEVEAEEEGVFVSMKNSNKAQDQLKAVGQQPRKQMEEESTSERIEEEEVQVSHEEQPEGELILFVGGIIFTDLEKLTKDAGKEKLKELKDIRVKCIVEMLQSFGEIKVLKKRWDRRYCHVIYADSADAKRAFESLTCLDERQKLKAEALKNVTAAGLSVVAVPSKYYVRWSSKEELMGKKPQAK